MPHTQRRWPHGCAKIEKREQAEKKGFIKFLGVNLTYLIDLHQVAKHNLILLVWKALIGNPKIQQLTYLQRVFNAKARRPGVRTPIVATHGLLKMSMYLSFHLNHRDELVMGIHQFYLWQNTYASRDFMKACIDQHHAIAGWGGSPTLDTAAYLTAPDGVSLPKTLAISRSAHMHLRVVLDTLMGRDHPSAHGMEALPKSIM